MNKNILITGSGGFIGRHLVDYFKEKKYTVFSPSINQLDLTNQKQLDRFFMKNKVDYVIHSAVKPFHRAAQDHDTLSDNLRMFLNLQRNETKFKKLVFIGSGICYGLDHYKPKMKEGYFGENIPTDQGGLSKFIISKLIESNPKMVDLRVFGIYGPGEDYTIRFISNLICKSIFGLPLSMNQNRKFDYIFVEDLAPIVEEIMLKNTKHKAYNITPDKSVDLLEIAHKIKRLTNAKQSIKIEKSGRGVEYSGSNKRFRSEFGQINFTSLDEGILKTYKWYYRNQGKLNNKNLMEVR